MTFPGRILIDPNLDLWLDEAEVAALAEAVPSGGHPPAIGEVRYDEVPEALSSLFDSQEDVF